MAQLFELYSGVALVTPQAPGGVCADCFLYDLQIHDGGSLIQVRADDTTLDESGAGELVKFLGQLRDRALRSAP
jgi:hypothetical protein